LILQFEIIRQRIKGIIFQVNILEKNKFPIERTNFSIGNCSGKNGKTFLKFLFLTVS